MSAGVERVRAIGPRLGRGPLALGVTPGFGPLRLLSGALAIGALAYFAAYLVHYARYPADDAFIHLRIARNFAATGLPYFDPAEPVAASSSLLWTLLLTGLFRVAGPRVDVVIWVEWTIAAGLLATSAMLLRERLSPPAAVAVAALLVAALVLHVGAMLMDTPLAVFLLLVSMLCWRAGKPGALGFFAGLALLARYEAVVWLGIAFALLPDRRQRLRFAAGAAGPLAAATLFALTYFGTVIANTVWAKSRVYDLTLAQFFTIAGVKGWKLVWFALGAALLLWDVLGRRRPAWVRAATLYSLALFALYAAARTLMFPWYWPLVLVPLALACAAAPSGRTLAAALLFVIATRAFWSAAAGELAGVVTADPSRFREFRSGARVQQYLRIGADLAARWPDASLMSSEVGALGWAFPGRIIDAAGLVTPAALAFHPMPVPAERSKGAWGAIPVGAVTAFQPDLVVSMDMLSEAFRRAQAAGALEYELVREEPVMSPADAARSGSDRVWQARVIQVFRRRDLVPPS